MQKLIQSNITFILGIVFFCYAVMTALIFQLFIVPNFLQSSGTLGLLANDAVLFHEVAVKLAADIHEFGWASWELSPANGASGNVAFFIANLCFIWQ